MPWHSANRVSLGPRTKDQSELFFSGVNLMTVDKYNISYYSSNVKAKKGFNG